MITFPDVKPYTFVGTEKKRKELSYVCSCDCQSEDCRSRFSSDGSGFHKSENPPLIEVTLPSSPTSSSSSSYPNRSHALSFSSSDRLPLLFGLPSPHILRRPHPPAPLSWPFASIPSLTPTKITASNGYKDVIYSKRPVEFSTRIL